MENIDNIYQAPASDLVISNTEKDFILASKWQRFFNNIIDIVGYYVFSVIIGVLLVLLFGQKGIETIDKIPGIFQGWIVVLLYYATLESLTCRTLGKLITGTKVVDYDGGKPTLRQIIGRTFTRLVPFEAFTFLGENGRGLHDRWPKTKVVKTRK